MHGFVCKYVGMNINQELSFPLTKTLYEYSRYQIYISDDSGLCHKSLPNTTLRTTQEGNASNTQVERVAFLSCTNASASAIHSES